MGLGIRRTTRDLTERLLSRFGLLPMVPPPEVAVRVGHGDFAAIGRTFLGHFIELGGLEPTHDVLDVGCGSGRMAVPLTGYLTGRSRYRGFDVSRAEVARCRNRITPRFPNFRFEWADVYNQGYNPAGRTPAREYRFPYPDRSFDFVFLTSVFTHMLPADVARFLAEIARVLRPGRRCLATYFLLTPESEAAVAAGRSALPFRYPLDACRLVSREQPEDAIAYPEGWVRAACERVGLRVQEPIRYGSWTGRPDGLTYQDVVVVEKV